MVSRPSSCRFWPTKEKTPSETSMISWSLCGGEEAYRNNEKMQRLIFTRRKIGLSVAIIVAYPSWLTPAKYSSKSSRVA